MRPAFATLPVLLGFLAAAVPALADSVSVSSSSDGTVVVNGKPCRVVTRRDGDGGGGNSSSVTAGGGVSGSTTISPGGSGSSVTVGSGSSSSSSGSHSFSAAGSDCVIYKNEK